MKVGGWGGGGRERWGDVGLDRVREGTGRERENRQGGKDGGGGVDTKGGTGRG